MFRWIRCFGFCVLMLSAGAAQAHFIWVDCLPQPGGKAQVRLYFSEEPAPGDRGLIGKIANTKVWLRDGQGAIHDVKAAPATDAKLAALVSNKTGADRDDVEATCDYGVYTRGPRPMLLQYYAKHLPDNWWKSGSRFTRSERLALDIVPRLDGTAVVLDVAFEGRPAAGRHMVIFDPKGDSTELKTDAEGRVRLEHLPAGRYAVRADYIQAKRGGTRNGKKYDETGHYATLVFDMPAAERADHATAAVRRIAVDSSEAHGAAPDHDHAISAAAALARRARTALSGRTFPVSPPTSF